MALLRGSTNYVWCTTSVLGKGATASVFQGVNKMNGEPVAVKTFNQLSHMRPQDVQLREFEVLRRVNHRNIVKLLAIEEEHEARGKVIIMELCTGGSLFNILDDPENTYGLEEGAFLQVLDDTSAGMKHLRDNNLVHRDLKPGNIMKFICDDGSTVYKLTDFGAARELPDGQQFASLYGTEEYLHPDMYERAVLRKQLGKTFGATVDLWSIGVTLYHVATGNLPFRPYGGRRNKEKMYYITTEKASGVISGIQTTENGPIEWGHDLPYNCQLSLGLKKIVTPLLAGLLEADASRVWSFERFFAEVRQILSRKRLSIFYANRASLIKVYIPPDETYEQLQTYIEDQTLCKPGHQLILHRNNLFVDIVGEISRAAGYPATNEEPLLLFSTDLQDVATVPFPDMPDFPQFAKVVSVENDASQAKMACSLGYVCKRRIEQCAQGTQLMRNCVEHFTEYLKSSLQDLERVTQQLADITSSYEQTAHAYQVAQTSINALLRSNMTKRLNVTNYVEDLSKLSEPFSCQTSRTVSQLFEKNVVENTLYLEWKSVLRNVKCPAETAAPIKARTLVERLRDSWQHLVRDRVTRSLSYNDEQFHLLERTKISGTNSHIKSLLEKECIPAFNQMAELLGDWYKSGQTIFLRFKILNKDVMEYKRRLSDFTDQMRIDGVKFREEIGETIRLERNAECSGLEQKPRLKSATADEWKKLAECENEKLEIRRLLSDYSQYVKQLSDITDSRSGANGFLLPSAE